MTHKLDFTNGSRMLAHSLTQSLDVFKTPQEVLRAGRLAERLSIRPPADNVDEWASDGKCEIEITEAERELLKAAVTKLAEKITPSAYSVRLLEQLGFE